MKTYLFEYRFDGDKYCMEVVAESADEARERLRLAVQGDYLGELGMKIPAAPVNFFGTWILDWLCWWKNWKKT